MPKLWTPAEKEIITKHYPNGEKETILNLLPGRRWTNIQVQAHYYGLHRRADTWIESDIVYLRTHHLAMSYGDMAKALGRPEGAIRNKASRLLLPHKPRSGGKRKPYVLKPKSILVQPQSIRPSQPKSISVPKPKESKRPTKILSYEKLTPTPMQVSPKLKADERPIKIAPGLVVWASPTDTLESLRELYCIDATGFRVAKLIIR